MIGNLGIKEKRGTEAGASRHKDAGDLAEEILENEKIRSTDVVLRLRELRLRGYGHVVRMSYRGGSDEGLGGAC